MAASSTGSIRSSFLHRSSFTPYATGGRSHENAGRDQLGGTLQFLSLESPKGTDTMDGTKRRPLASRNTAWAHNITRWLAATSVTPNQISMASMGAAGVAGACFWLAGQVEGAGVRA